ncbi:unnamed protein product [Somion occarium]|uniref:Uncharacterized protein n=1 Tax=Somion occarium TaxID=3059160 RepID=A0ABP1DFQ5_9APHY
MTLDVLAVPLEIRGSMDIRGSNFTTRALFGGAQGEFVGFHGTNGANAQVYMARGNAAGGGIPVPPAFNGADAELGPGLYVSDDITVAQMFASGSAAGNRNRGNTLNGANTPFICVVTANNQNEWRNTVRKVWVPVNEIATLVSGRNDVGRLAAQERRMAAIGGTRDNTVRFSILDKDRPTTPRNGNQMVLPAGVQSKFSIKICAPVSSTINRLLADLRSPSYPQFSYLNLRTPWHIF